MKILSALLSSAAIKLLRLGAEEKFWSAVGLQGAVWKIPALYVGWVGAEPSSSAICLHIS
jgi:hypothetical protein